VMILKFNKPTMVRPTHCACAQKMSIRPIQVDQSNLNACI